MSVKIDDMDHLMRSRHTVQCAATDVLSCLWKGSEQQRDVCRATNVPHNEVY